MPPGGGPGEPVGSPGGTRRRAAPAAARRGLAGETGFPPRDRAAGEGGGMTRSRVARMLGLVVAVCGFAAGVLALLLAADVGRIERALAADDARFVSRPLAG